MVIQSILTTLTVNTVTLINRIFSNYFKTAFRRYYHFAVVILLIRKYARILIADYHTFIDFTPWLVFQLMEIYFHCGFQASFCPTRLLTVRPKKMVISLPAASQKML